MYMRYKGTVIPQHAHTYAHHSMLARGSVALWKDGEFIRNYQAPAAILIDAGVKHTFMNLEPDTIVYCIHNVSRDGEVSIQSEHNIDVSANG